MAYGINYGFLLLIGYVLIYASIAYPFDQFYGSSILRNSLCDKTNECEDMKEYISIYTPSKDITEIQLQLEAGIPEVYDQNLSNTQDLMVTIAQGENVDNSVKINLTFLKTLIHLRRLWIFGSRIQTQDVLFKQNVSILHHLQITDLHINLKFRKFENIKWFFKSLPHLQVLDIQNAKLLPDFSVIFDESSSYALSSITLKNVQSFYSRTHYQQVWNLTAMFRLNLRSSLKYLDISENDLQYIYHDMLNAYPSLEIVDISENMLAGRDCINYTPIIFHPNLKALNFGFQGLTHAKLAPTTSNSEYNTYRQRRNAGSVSKLFDLIQDFPQSRNCQPIDVNRIIANHSYFAEKLNCFASIKLFDYKQIPKQYIPPFSQLFGYSECINNLRIPVAPKLKILAMENIRGSMIYGHYEKGINRFNCVKNNSLMYFSFSANTATKGFIENIANNIYGFDKLLNLNLRDTVGITLDTDSFHFVPNVHFLYLGGSKFYNISETFSFCSSMKHLRILELSAVGWSSVPTNILNDCRFLELLDLSNNQLPYIPKQLRDVIDAMALHHDVKVDLSNNILSCQCHQDDVGTIKWIQQSSAMFINHGTYRCRGHGDIEFVLDKNLDELSNICSETRHIVEAVLYTIFACVLTFASVLGTYCLHKFRYRLKTSFYRLKLYVFGLTGNAISLNTDMVYDVYLAHCREDNDFVRYVLLKKLENSHGLKCCVPDRNFPGSGIMLDHIDQYMSHSRVILYIISKASNNDPLFHFAMKMGRTQERFILNRSKILYITREDPNTITIGNGIIQSILDSKLCFFWPGELNCQTKKVAQKQDECLAKVISKIFQFLPSDIELQSSALGTSRV